MFDLGDLERTIYVYSYRNFEKKMRLSMVELIMLP